MNRFQIIGFFVIGGLALFTTGLFLIGNRHEAFARHVDLYTELFNVSGIAQGAKVQVAGMDAGQVLDVDVPGSPAAKFRIKIRINERLRGLVRTDSVVTVGTEGVVGNRFLEIKAGSAGAPEAAAGAILEGAEPTDISDLLVLAKGTIGNIDKTIGNANHLMTDADGLITTLGGNMNSALTEARQTVSNANEVIAGVKAGRGTAGMLLRDEELAEKVRQAVVNVHDATSDLKGAAANAGALVSDLQSRQLPQQLDGTLKEVKQTASNFNAASLQVRKAVADFTGPDEGGVTAASTIRESLTNVRTATANIADDAEALKHNFLLRGFFKKRGYYDLANLSADPYRIDPVFSARSNERIWLRADQLFRTDSQGTEEVSAEGRAALNATLASFGARIFEMAIVIEGYCDSSQAAERVPVSRLRAILVRNYLQSQFHLDSGKLGTIALENRPPDSSGHPSWSGVAIVLLKPKS